MQLHGQRRFIPDGFSLLHRERGQKLEKHIAQRLSGLIVIDVGNKIIVLRAAVKG